MAKDKIIDKVVEVEKIQLPTIVELKEVLNANPHVHVIYVNVQGDWHFMARPGFAPYEREDILNG